MKIESTLFGKTAKQVEVQLYTITNDNGASIQLTNYGAILVSLNVPDASGKLANVNAGFASLDDYLKGHPMFGATVGRFANRIAKGKFSIGDEEYKLALNGGPNHIHGGVNGFDKKVWRASEIKSDDSAGLRFEVFSSDGEEGYPGNLHVYADYMWSNDQTLTIRFEATVDNDTHLNLTNHAYFNLHGIGNGDIKDHELTLYCDQVLDVDETLIPTGKLNSVTGSALDFTKARAIGDRISEVAATKGYDHCFVVNGEVGQLRKAALVVDPVSKRTMEIHTTQPGVQLYTGNHLGGNDRSAGLGQHQAFCLETQHYPDSPNRPEFPSTLLRPGKTFTETTTYRFGVA
jgi:aldose 1-epimerase